MFKKILAGVVTAVLSLGAVVLLAGPASAHHNTITAKVVCNTDGQYKVVWSVTNSEGNKTEKITASSLPGVVSVGTSFNFNETKQFVQIVPAPQNLELDLTGFWDGDTSTTNDDVYHSDSGWFGKDSFPSGCLQVTPSATKAPSVCDGPNHYTDPTYTIVDVTGVKYTVDGVPTAPGTYPATNPSTVNIVASVTDPKYKIVGTSSWSFTFEAPAAPCTVEVDPVDPDFKQQVCTGPGTHDLAEYLIPNTTGVLYFVKIDGGAETPVGPGWHDVPDGVQTVQIIAKGDTNNFYVLKGGTKIWDFDLTPAGKCLTKVEPKTPTVKDGQCDLVNYPGVVPEQSYTLYYVEHIVYQVSINGGPFTDVVLTGDQTFPVAPGTSISVRATVDDTTKYEAKPALSFTKTFGDPGDCKPELTPIAPSGTAQYCDDSDPLNPILVDGTITLTTVAGIQYYIDGAPAASGVPIPVTPGPHTVTAGVSDPTKYKIAVGAVTSWPVDIDPGECLPTNGLVQPIVSSSQIGCFTSGSYTLSNDQADPAAVIWTVNGSQVSAGKYTVSGSSTVTITAAPNAPLWGFDPSAQTSWTVDFKKPSVCDIETLALTGQSPTGLLIAADLLVVAGLAMFAMRAVRRGRLETA